MIVERRKGVSMMPYDDLGPYNPDTFKSSVEQEERNNWWKGPRCAAINAKGQQCKYVGYTLIDGKHYCSRHQDKALAERLTKRND